MARTQQRAGLEDGGTLTTLPCISPTWRAMPGKRSRQLGMLPAVCQERGTDKTRVMGSAPRSWLDSGKGSQAGGQGGGTGAGEGARCTPSISAARSPPFRKSFCSGSDASITAAGLIKQLSVRPRSGTQNPALSPAPPAAQGRDKCPIERVHQRRTWIPELSGTGLQREASVLEPVWHEGRAGCSRESTLPGACSPQTGSKGVQKEQNSWEQGKSVQQPESAQPCKLGMAGLGKPSSKPLTSRCLLPSSRQHHVPLQKQPSLSLVRPTLAPNLLLEA